MIPAEAVEAAAKAAFARTHPHGNFRLAIRELQDRYLSEARAALEAAAPYMLAGAWDEAIEAYKAWTWDDENMDPLANPYRPANAV